MERVQSKDQFQQLISQEKPVIMKFTAGWCPDCRRMDMFIDDIIAKYDQYDWYEIDRDEFPEIAEKYDVMGIPSLLIFKNGEKQAHLHSAHAKSPEQVIDFLQSV
ncbi:thioredoxin family protein [Bacillus sp. PK3_68]|uniref:thioredoxin family protein n=1 Tax=Bacillus sp. PK3_68 TaxID=2027408 RepID=UPI000E768C19|nr:thioredoxin family protein [Bacillus sp. PK3_68]RJS60347.1 thiol reductase thioredoxin [Bacillus sp. PK3_68]